MAADAAVGGAHWAVVKEAWDGEDEKSFEAFVRAIGRSNCTSIADCLDNPANPYRSAVDPTLYGDCADMAYVLRAYFAWKHGLPFAYQSAMRTADGAPADLRYSPNGNVVAGKRAAHGAKTVDARAYLSRIGGEVSTAMFRTHPVSGGGALYDDFYPIDISRRSVRPGVIAYDIYGHVGIVYDVLEDGRVLIVASHPDNSVSRSVYGPNFLRAKPELGAGLKAWRPIRIEGASRRKDGSLSGGRIVATKNEEIDDYSLVQFFGNGARDPSEEWHEGDFVLEGRTYHYYDYVRRRLAAPGYRYHPVTEFSKGLDEICGAAIDRKTAVDRALDAGVHLRPHPERMPPNIYGTYGEWENFSTPSRDARLKVSFVELRRDVQQLYERTKAGDPGLVYDGADLAGDLWRAWETKKDACNVVYRRSDGTRMMLNLGHVMDRLWDLSFDPYHCPERRWGAGRGVEFETCTDDDAKHRWYSAQRFLRYQAERTYDVRMDFLLDELKSPTLAPPAEGGLGVESPPDADLRAYLQSINAKTLAESEGAPAIYPVGYEPPVRQWVPYWLALQP